jgi:vacuolar-type H+-ATPase subunit I/STV1
MVRPRLLEDAKTISLVFDKIDFDIVEKERGRFGISEYIRNLIRETQTGVEGKENLEKKRQKELRVVKAKLEVFERKEMAISQERRDAMKDISKGYNTRLLTFPNATLSQQQNWLEAQCKGVGIGLVEMMAYINNPDIFADIGSGEKEDINL